MLTPGLALDPVLVMSHFFQMEGTYLMILRVKVLMASPSEQVVYTLYMYYFYILALKKKAPNQAQEMDDFQSRITVSDTISKS